MSDKTHFSSRRRFLQALGYSFAKVAMPTPLLTLASADPLEITDDMYDAFAEDPKNLPIIRWLDIIEEMRLNQLYTNEIVRQITASGNHLTPKQIRDAAGLFLTIEPDTDYCLKELDGAASALRQLQPTLAEIERCIGHPIMQAYGPDLLVGSATKSKTANMLQQLSQASSAQLQSFIERLMARNAEINTPLIDLTNRIPAIRDEVAALREFHANGPKDIPKNETAKPENPNNAATPRSYYPAFATVYREATSPIPHDYYHHKVGSHWQSRLNEQGDQLPCAKR